jgi:PIN domain nuclease of toxin-antitoxin system
MNVLVDTQAFIWFDSNPEKLSELARDAFSNPDYVRCLSFASVWEMQIKIDLGKLRFQRKLGDLILDQQRANNIEILPTKVEHVFALGGLPQHHKDPFDRLIIAQALHDKIPVVTSDPLFAKYGVQVIW